jgi:hypothetical protein
VTPNKNNNDTITTNTRYAVAAGTALAQVTGLPQWVTTLAFAAGMALCVVVADNRIAQIMSGMTLVKGALLIAMVGLVAYVAGVVAEPAPQADWSKIIEPVVLGTLAIGGAINCQPLLFRELERACGWWCGGQGGEEKKKKKKKKKKKTVHAPSKHSRRK